MKLPQLLFNRFSLKSLIGKGSFGHIFLAEDILHSKKVAVKIESIHSRQLETEASIFQFFPRERDERTSTCVPKFYFYASEENYRILAMQLLGPSIEKLFVSMNKHFSLKTILMLADQMISCLEFLHKNNVIHQDIKTDNFAVSFNPQNPQSPNSPYQTVFILDFGLSKRYINSNGEHIPYTEGKSLIGTPRYASVNALQGHEQSRRDDMEALGYLLLYLLIGSLPWQGLAGKTREEKVSQILEVKSHTNFEELCKGYPIEFYEYITKVRSLEFEEEPHYSEYRQLFRNLFIRLGYVYDYQYDWTPKEQTMLSIQSVYPQASSPTHKSIPETNCLSKPSGRFCRSSHVEDIQMKPPQFHSLPVEFTKPIIPDPKDTKENPSLCNHLPSISNPRNPISTENETKEKECLPKLSNNEKRACLKQRSSFLSPSQRVTRKYPVNHPYHSFKNHPSIIHPLYD